VSKLTVRKKRHIEVTIGTWKKLTKLKAEWDLDSLDEVIIKLLDKEGIK